MARFTSSARLAAWAGLAPGDNESAGKRKKAPARKGNPHLRAAMVEGAWAVSRTASPARGPVPAPDLPVRQAQRQESRSRRGSHTAMYRLGSDEAGPATTPRLALTTTTSGTSATTSISSATIKPKLLDLDYANMGHDLPKRCPEQDSVLAADLGRSGQVPVREDHRSSNGYHVAPACGFFWLRFWSVPWSLRRSLPLFSRHADVTWD